MRTIRRISLALACAAMMTLGAGSAASADPGNVVTFPAAACPGITQLYAHLPGHVVFPPQAALFVPPC